MNIVKTNLLILTLGLSLAAFGSVKADCLCKCITEADLVKNMSIVELLGKMYHDRAVRSLGGPAGFELVKRASTAAVLGTIKGAKASLAFIKNHPSIARYSAAVSAGFCGALFLQAAIKKAALKKEMLAKQKEARARIAIVYPGGNCEYC